VNVWIALCDTTEANGALAVIPGSHRLPLTRRGTATPPVIAAPPEVVAKHMTVVPMRGGQAILYEPRTIHGSASNISGRPRVAAAMTVVPAGVTPLHYVGGGGGGDATLREVSVDADFFHAYAVDPALGRDPEIEALIAGRPVRTVPATVPITTEGIRGLAPPGALGRFGRLRRRFASTG
jgi:hypothetical protein